MSDLSASIAAIEAMRLVIGDAAADAALAALRGDTPPVQQRIEANEGGSASGNRQTIVMPGGTYNEAPPDPNLPKQERALIAYLRRTRGECNALALGTLDATDAEQRPVELARVYIGLNVVSRVPLPEQARKARPNTDSNTRQQTAIEAVLNCPERRLTLLGAPGGGKSTFVNHLALCLAGAALEERRITDPQPADGWLARIPGWTLGALLPVRVVLRDFAAFPALAAAQRGSAGLLREFLAHTLALAGCAGALEPLEAALAEGRAILLLDGLDEVVGDRVLMLVGESITDTARLYAQSPAVITCRVLDFQATKLRQLPHFTEELLADLSDEQIGQFVADWYDELAHSGRRTAAQAADDARVLRAAIRARPELQALARTPLLLTVMALVHASRGALPDARALLYYECVDLLLLRWRRRRDEPDLLARLDLPQFHATHLLGLMARLGFAAHEAAERMVESIDRPADLSRLEVMNQLAEGFRVFAPERSFGLAEQLLHELERGNGLLLKRGPDQYAFPHRTFQEFLAGYHLLSTGQYLRRCKERAPQVHWHEALLLMAGYQTLAGGDPEKPLTLARELLRRSPAERALAGEILNLVGRAAAETNDPDYVAPGGLWEQARDALLALSTIGQAPAAPAPLRARAGKALGVLCYGTLEKLAKSDAAPPLPDARLPLAVLGLAAQEAPWWREALGAYWRPVEAGIFWFGDDTSKQPLRQVDLPSSFHIARFPVTNADYARFVANGGYDDERWWTPEGWKNRATYGLIAPPLFGNLAYNNSLQPVAAVSWYEAAAYCSWLTAQAHAQGWLLASDIIRLPTSLEWERAARGTDRRRYPWGDDPPTPEHANHNASQIGGPSPVGCFPRDTSPCGAQDVSGNLMEWLATEYKEQDALAPRKEYTDREAATLSHGCWDCDIERLCCGARDWIVPGDGNLGSSFRVVRSPTLDP